jgi:hypothetical protein
MQAFAAAKNARFRMATCHKQILVTHPEEELIPVLQRSAKGVPPLPLFFAKTNKHAGENEQGLQNRLQKLDIKELTNQNLENKGLRASWFEFAALCRPRR